MNSSAVVLAISAIVLALLALVAFELSSSHRIAGRARREQRRSMADRLLYRRHIRRNVITLANGGYLAMYEVDAADADGFDDNALGEVEHGLARAIGSLDDRFIVHLRERHVRVREYTRPVSYVHPVLEWLDELRARYFESGATFRTRRVLHLASRKIGAAAPEEEVSPSRVGAIGALVRRMLHVYDGPAVGESEDEDEVREDALAVFERELASAEAYLRSYARVRRLGVRRDVIGGVVPVLRSEMLEELTFAIRGREAVRTLPETLLALSSYLAEPMRGRYDIRIGDDELAILVLKGFPQELEALALSELRRLGVEYELVVRWMPLSPTEARGLVKGAHVDWKTKANESSLGDPYAEEMMGEGRDAAGLVSRGVRLGLLSPFVVLRARDRRSVDALAQQAVALLDRIGFPAFIASKTAVDDFFATLPGDGYSGLRAYQMHALNFVHIANLHEQSNGARVLGVPYLPRDAGPIAYGAAGNDDTNFGLSLATDPPDVLHHFGVGGTGRGKSVSLAMLTTSWVGRVPFAGATVIDRGRSLYRLSCWLDAPFYDVLGARSPGFALFADADDPIARNEIAELLVGMAEIQGVPVTPQRRAAIVKAVEHVAQLRRELRCMTAFYELVGDPEGCLRPAFYWYTENGPLGKTLDATEDSFDVARFCGIDLGAVWTMDAKFLIPLLLVMFWKIRTAVFRRRARSGSVVQPWLFEVDEAHTLLDHPLGQRFIRDTFKMGRRELFALGLWSNAAREFATSPILNDLLEACRTRFYFGSTDVLDNAEVRTHYAALGLPDHGVSMLPNLAPHTFLVHQPSIRVLRPLDWRLQQAELAVLGRTNARDNAWLDEVMAEFPYTWREELLRAEGIDEDTIARMTALRSQGAAAEATAAS